MAGKPVNVTIGATLAASVGATMRGAQAQLQRLGSTISTLNNHKISVDQFQKLRADAGTSGLVPISWDGLLPTPNAEPMKCARPTRRWGRPQPRRAGRCTRPNRPRRRPEQH